MKFGLPNIGYTCYLNTSLQCLFHNEHFVQFLNTLEPDLMSLNELHHTFTDQESSKKNKHRSYIHFLKLLHKHIPMIDINEENDIHEFIVLFIDVYFEYFKRVVPVRKPTTKTTSAIIKYNSDAHWYNKYSGICDVLFSQHLIKIQCKDCGHKLHNYETTSIISIDISNSIHSVKDGVEDHFTPLAIDDWKCDKCNMRNNSQKTSYIIRTPKILAICLKRFSFENNKVVKNEQDIKIDKLLDMSKYFYFDTETESTYSLKSVALHHGNPYNGHYTTMLFDNDDEKTFIDDMDIVKMNDKDFNINNDAYLLLYERNS